MDVPVHAHAGDTETAAATTAAHIAPQLEAMALAIVTHRASTSDEVHALIEERLGRKVELYSVRPRLSALLRKGLVADTGERRLSAAGRCKCRVLRATTPAERQAFVAERVGDRRG